MSSSGAIDREPLDCTRQSCRAASSRPPPAGTALPGTGARSAARDGSPSASARCCASMARSIWRRSGRSRSARAATPCTVGSGTCLPEDASQFPQCYRRRNPHVPHFDGTIPFLFTVGAGTQPVHLSEYGVGSLLDAGYALRRGRCRGEGGTYMTAHQGRRFEVVEGWERLPDGFSHADCVGVGTDAQDNVYLLTRPAAGDRLRPRWCLPALVGG